MRKDPEIAPGEPLLPGAINPNHPTDEVVDVRSYQLLTPLFGGGAVTQQADAVTTVRAAEIRGQLRFWWRAIRGGFCNGDLALMRRREAAIFGAASTIAEPRPSPLSVVVSDGRFTGEVHPWRIVRGESKYVKESRIPQYAGFPLKPDAEVALNLPQGTAGTASVTEGVAFTVTLRYPKTVKDGTVTVEMQEELNAALWAWETFGGIGARTRRGFGTLHQKQEENGRLPNYANKERALDVVRAKLKTHLLGDKWPIGVAHIAEKTIIKAIQRSAVDVVWKAVIEEYRKFRQDLKPNSDEAIRLASRLILKPAAFTLGANREAVAIALVLEGASPPPPNPNVQVTAAERAALSNLNAKVRTETDVVRAFLNTL